MNPGQSFDDAPESEIDKDGIEFEFWVAIKDGSDPDDFALYLEHFPRGAYGSLARAKLEALRRPTDGR